ncbi:MAG: hypothetical protein HQ594_01305, partial [Candidatus Omnitrophica bacterium]|nr:hypothetical protein [Candidatus Omnitrophota bacterium]
MIEFSESLEDSGSVVPRKKEVPEELSLASKAGKEETLDLASSLDEAEAFYNETLSFITPVLDAVAESEKKIINPDAILKWSDKACDFFLKVKDLDSIIYLIGKNDRCEPNY